MKKEIKVYLQYPWKFPDSPYYKYLIDSPPEKIKYLNVENQKGVITSKNKFLFLVKLKRILRNVLNSLNISVPNAHLSPSGNYDLVHCAHCLSKNNDKPWVADMESIWQLWVSIKNPKNQSKISKILLKSNCKKILPWTKKTREEILKEFPEIKEKVELVYPAVPVRKIRKKSHKGLNLLFVGRYFYEKGGLSALKVIDYLTRKHNNVNGIFVSEVPKDILTKYSNNKKIKFHNLIPQEKLFRDVMPVTDILVYPGYTDTFGFAFLEAMSFGIPVITTGGNAKDEIVDDGKTGFLVDKVGLKEYLNGFNEEEIVRKISKKTELLIKNIKLRKMMSKNCINEIKYGKFSIKERNKRLKYIYRESLK